MGCFPTTILEVGGLTPGLIALALNFSIYVLISLVFPSRESGRKRVEELYCFLEAPVPVKDLSQRAVV